MKQYPNITTVRSVIENSQCEATCVNGKWVPARPMGYMSLGQRFKAAWLVFTGKADALLWDGQ